MRAKYALLFFELPIGLLLYVFFVFCSGQVPVPPTPVPTPVPTPEPTPALLELLRSLGWNCFWCTWGPMSMGRGGIVLSLAEAV